MHRFLTTMSGLFLPDHQFGGTFAKDNLQLMETIFGPKSGLRIIKRKICELTRNIAFFLDAARILERPLPECIQKDLGSHRNIESGSWSEIPHIQ